MGRALDRSFTSDLQTGCLKPLLDLTREDHSLSLAVRDKYVNIYYRGGSLMKVEQKAKGSYQVFFDPNYVLPGEHHRLQLPLPPVHSLPQTITSDADVAMWVDNLPLLKCAMDVWMACRKHPAECEFMQLVESVNNRLYVTDYVLADLYYTLPGNTDTVLDLVAFQWARNRAGNRKTPLPSRLSIIEGKYGAGALSGNAGIVDHVETLRSLISRKPTFLADLADQAWVLFEQRHELGLIHWDNAGRHSFAAADLCRPEYVLLLADQNPYSEVLWRELAHLQGLAGPGSANLPFDITVATATFMGYALYVRGMLSLDNFIAGYRDGKDATPCA